MLNGVETHFRVRLSVATASAAASDLLLQLHSYEPAIAGFLIKKSNMKNPLLINNWQSIFDSQINIIYQSRASFLAAQRNAESYM